MQDIHKKSIGHVPGRALAFFIIPLLLTIVVLNRPLVENNHFEPAFTDVRVLKLIPSQHYLQEKLIKGVTIHTDFNYTSIWCRRHDSNALPCPRPFWDERQEQFQNLQQDSKGIPVL